MNDMNDMTDLAKKDRPDTQARLARLREPFPPHHISKLPKPTKAQTDAVKADYRAGIRCEICGAWHHPQVVHLDYVGHAALTDRLLDVDLEWTWEPMALDAAGHPALDRDGGLWIRLTVCGITRLGYGDAQGKTGGDAMKERIGDALRNAAMRFGAALDLWHKGDLHIAEAAESSDSVVIERVSEEQAANIRALLEETGSDERRFLAWLKVDSIEAIQAAAYDMCVGQIEKKRRA